MFFYQIINMISVKVQNICDSLCGNNPCVALIGVAASVFNNLIKKLRNVDGHDCFWWLGGSVW